MNNNADQKKLIGDFSIVGIQGKTLSDYDKDILSTYSPIGILLLARNYNFGVPYSQWLAEYSTLLEEIKKYTGRSKMLITLDHEGGHVIRPPVPITRFPYPRLFKDKAPFVATAIAKEMKSLGVNVCWSPDTDIFSNPVNTVIGNRAFGTTTTDVVKYAISFFKTFAKEGIIGCAKHFPGHGDTIADSHVELPVINKSWEEIQAMELLPFIEMIKENVPVVMSTHILFPKIDPENPATLSRKITYKALREDLNFKGVICSDDLHMRAIMNRFQEKGNMAKAFNAGLDMFIMARHPGDPDLLPIMGDDLVECLNQGSITEDMLRESRERVIKLLNMAGDFTPFVMSDAMLREHYELALEIACGG